MTLEDYLRVARERWKIIAIAVLIGILGALVLFIVRPATYTASTSLFVSAQVGDNPQQAFQGAQLSEQRVKSYNELVTGERVMSETIRQLNLSEAEAQLASSVTATNAADSVIINISVNNPSPERAALIADAIGNVTSQVVDELERPAAPNGTPAVAVRVVQPASVPTSPSSTSLQEMLLYGLVAGLVLGTAVALVCNTLDTSTKNITGLNAATGAPNLGAIAFDSKMPNEPLTVHKDPQSPRSEAYRQIRTNLKFVDVDQQAKTFVVTSAMPSEGKTTTVANLAIAMASAGGQVLVIEADLRRPKLADLLGMDRSVGLTRVLTGELPLENVIQQWNGGMLDLLASGPVPPNPSELLSSNKMRSLIGQAQRRYDYILIDTPPLLPVTDAAAVAPMTDGVILVCRYKKTTKLQLESAREALRSVSARVLGSVFTMVPTKGPLAYAKYHSYYSPTAEATTGVRDPALPTSREHLARPDDHAYGPERRDASRTHRLSPPSPGDRRRSP